MQQKQRCANIQREVAPQHREWETARSNAMHSLAEVNTLIDDKDLLAALSTVRGLAEAKKGPEQVEVYLKEASICRSLAQETGDGYYYDSAWKVVQKAYATASSVSPPYQYGLYASLMEWGIINAEKGQLAKAYACYREARRVVSEYDDINTQHWVVGAAEKIAESIAMFADSGKSLHPDQNREAQSIIESAISINKKLRRPMDPETNVLYRGSLVILESLQEWDTIVKNFRSSRAAQEKIYAAYAGIKAQSSSGILPLQDMLAKAVASNNIWKELKIRTLLVWSLLRLGRTAEGVKVGSIMIGRDEEYKSKGMGGICWDMVMTILREYCNEALTKGKAYVAPYPHFCVDDIQRTDPNYVSEIIRNPRAR
eukprot:TRINITY_DN1091_c0_g2_i3.p1 TRINITY_DN1091_c0_g2~~TRINITY_DN1091_c0_g2_i3.p1  ORF type:complete len:370 (+),score=66.14 TRINITY_DN1091_c0_g2_i3:267-1376(+)